MKKRFITLAAVCMAAIMAFLPVNVQAATLLRIGSRGNEVKSIQSSLMDLGYFTYYRTTGYYGRITQAAVRSFQRENGLLPDGIIGNKTRGALCSITSTASVSGSAAILLPMKAAFQNSGDLNWFTEVRDIWRRGQNALVTDVDTGKSFYLKRTYGTNHADVETLTKTDTNTVKEIWRGFSWERRAVVVQIGKYTIAGSMTAMPHAGLDSKPAGVYVYGRSAGYGWGYNYDKVKGNGINGHMDIHFKNSRTHTTNVVQKSHQDMVAKANNYIRSLLLAHNT